MFFTVEKLMFFNSVLFGLAGVVSNLICLFLVYIVKNKDMKRFRQLLMLYCCCDVFFSLSHMISQPGFALSSNVYLFFSYAKWESVLIGKIMLSICTFFFIQSITILMVLFVYRYFAVSTFFRNRCNSSLWIYVLLLLTVTVLPIAYCFPPLSALWEKPGVTKNDFITTIDTLFDNPTSKTYELIASFGFKNGETSSEDLNFIVFAFLMAFSIISLECSVIIYCSVRITLATNGSYLSNRTKKIQRQLFYYLVIQITVTMSCCSFQVVLFVVATYFNIPLGAYGTLSTGMLAWFPILDSIILLTSVTAYRNQIVGILLRRSINPESSTIINNKTDQKLDRS